MKRDAHWLLALLGTFALFLSTAGSTLAQDVYPSKPIRLVIPYPPGGGTDTVARIIVPRVNQTLGQQLVVDNRGGAGGNIGADVVAKAAPDGYTLGLFDAAFLVNPSLYSRLPFDTLQDFRPVTIVAESVAVLVVHPSKASSLQQLIASAKAKPGGYTYGSAGNGSPLHLYGEMFKAAAGIDILHVAYKGAGPAIADLVAGHIDMMFINPGVVLGHVNTGKLRPVATTGNHRWSKLPQVATFVEAGLPGIDLHGLWTITAPAKVMQSHIDVLYSAFKKVLELRAIRDQFDELSFIAVGSDPDQSAIRIKSEIERWGRAVKVSGTKAE
jgi:tripartite-type tricarboxylate transporter receptor subunit TctC